MDSSSFYNLLGGFAVLAGIYFFFAGLICLACVGLCVKIYTEMMKEHTIRKRYEMQGEKKV